MKKMALVAMIGEGVGPWMRPSGTEKCARVSNLGDAKVFMDVNLTGEPKTTAHAFSLVEGDNDLSGIVGDNVARYCIAKESGDGEQLATTVEILL